MMIKLAKITNLYVSIFKTLENNELILLLNTRTVRNTKFNAIPPPEDTFVHNYSLDLNQDCNSLPPPGFFFN